jgi:hypothetical protein
MNVLILTPDAVGSTLLQRLLTIYMQFHSFDKPVINLHELTNGIIKYHHTGFDQDVLGKPDRSAWGYHQSLEQIVGLLDSADHYKTSRLAQYHIKNRRDSLVHQVPFYRYLNDNFFIIACHRHNVFEHALSWAITKLTKKLNVYSSDEKIESFYHLYRDQILIDPQSLIQTLEAYKMYLRWCNDHFSVASYFYYDEHLPNIEKYILDLPIFAGQSVKNSWHKQFDIEFNDWNRCHYLSSDIGTLALENQEKFQQLSFVSSDLPAVFIADYDRVADPSWPKINSVEDFNSLAIEIKEECLTIHNINLPVAQIDTVHHTLNLTQSLPDAHTKFLKDNVQQYELANQSIAKMVDERIMISPPPIKKQTMNEKKFLIKNFNACLDVYNNWILQNPEIGKPIDIDIIDQFAKIESTYWKPDSQDQTFNLIKAVSNQP